MDVYVVFHRRLVFQLCERKHVSVVDGVSPDCSWGSDILGELSSVSDYNCISFPGVIHKSVNLSLLSERSSFEQPHMSRRVSSGE